MLPEDLPPDIPDLYIPPPPVPVLDDAGVDAASPSLPAADALLQTADAVEDEFDPELDDDPGDERSAAGAGVSPQARMRALMAIPDSLKTEAQWDELIELEIAVAQGGRQLNLSSRASRPQSKPNLHKQAQRKPVSFRPQASAGAAPDGTPGSKPHGAQGRKHGRRFFKKPGKPSPG